jgi:hypothetical protein
MRTLRYGADARWDFSGHNLPLDPHAGLINQAILTISGGWADTDAGEEQPPAPPNELVVLTIDVNPSPSGAVTDPGADGLGNWRLYFLISAADTTSPVLPPPTYLWYEVTLLLDDGSINRPYVGQVRMLPDLYAIPGP